MLSYLALVSWSYMPFIMAFGKGYNRDRLLYRDTPESFKCFYKRIQTWYPAIRTWRNYVDFWGENECKSTRLRECPVKPHVDNLRDHKGLTVSSTKGLLVSGAEDTVTVTVDEVDCPE